MNIPCRFGPVLRRQAVALFVVALGCAAAHGALATSGGVDTPPGVLELPLATHGQVGIDLYDSVSDPTQPTPQQLSTTTAPPNVIVPGNMAIGTTSLPSTPVDVNGAIRPGSSTAVSTCGSGQAAGEGSIRYNYTLHQIEYCNGTTWAGQSSSGGLATIAPYQILTGTTSTVTRGKNPYTGVPITTLNWLTLPLPSVPSGAKFVVIQYAYEIGGPDGVDNSYIQSAANATAPIYYITAGRSSWGHDSTGGAGQTTVPFDPATNSILVSVTPYDFLGGFYTLWVVGYR